MLHHKTLVLVVDDSMFERHMLTNELTKCGYEVETVADGQLALERMSAGGSVVPDIVLMDAVMPVMDGFAACKAIGELPPGQLAPVLMVTSHEDATSIDRAFDVGAEDYIIKPVNIALLHRRISRIVKAQQADCLIRDMAYRDILTGLPNRRMFEEELDRRLSHAIRYQESMAIALMDLDKFKQVNDNLGHAAGDIVLMEISRRFLSVVRASDFVSRLGGDEFLIIFSQIGDQAALEPLMHRIISLCEEPIICGEKSAVVGISIGVVFFPTDGSDVIELIRKADAAMYQSKSKSGSGFTCYAQPVLTTPANPGKMRR